MDFGFNDDQDLLRDSTRRFLEAHQPLARVRQRLEEPEVFEAELWEQGAALGWTAMLVPPEFDGGSVTAQPLVDLVVLAEELGRALNPGPLVPCSVVADALVRFGSEVQRSAHLPALASGEATAAWCLSADGSPDPTGVEVRISTRGDERELRGVARYVQGAEHATLLLVVACDEAGAFRTVLVPRAEAGLTVRTLSGLDLTRRFAEVKFHGVRVPASQELGPADAVIARALAVATVVQAAESVGAADGLLAATVDYARKRVQFGRPIGSFQALKHRFANLAMELEAMRAATHYAALALCEDLEDVEAAVATAGAYVDDAFAHLSGEVVQLHGGIGFTWEHDAHLFVRRAKVNQVLYGDGAWHRERLVRLAEAATEPFGAAVRSAAGSGGS